MSRVSPKPIIAQVLQTWDLPLGMKIALVEDLERSVWVVESCPAGTHFWTPAQARELAQTGRVGQAIRAAVTAAAALKQSSVTPIVKPQPKMPETSVSRRQPVVPAGRAIGVRSQRQATRRDKAALCA